MSAHQSLIGELEEAIQGGSREARIDTLRRVTDLFLSGADQFNEEQIGVFDDVLGHLIERIETKARIELAKRLAPVEQAPTDVIKTLACDDEIAVAGPVLTQSKRLSTNDLIEIAQSKGQAHLLAIAGRETIEERLTDVLVDRGDRKVMHTLADNSGAKFSNAGYATLVKRGEADEGLAMKLGLRLDIPLQLFRQLLLRATEAVRERLLASASEESRATIKRVLAEASIEVGREAPAVRNVADAQRLVMMMQETGRLNESEVLSFARADKFDEVVAAIATMTGAPVDLVERVMGGTRTDAALVPCKAAALSWPTVRSVLEMRGAGRAAEHDIEIASFEYAKLSTATAKRVLRFWQVRQSAGAPTAE